MADADRVERNRHGTRTLYQAGCRCLLCRAANAQYSAALRQRRLHGRAVLGTLVPAHQVHRLLRRLLAEYGTVRRLLQAVGVSRWPGAAQVRRRTAARVARLWRQVQHDG